MELLPEEVVHIMNKSIYHNYLYFTSYSNINQKYLLVRASLFSLIQNIAYKMNFRSNTYFLSFYYLDLIFLNNKIPSIYHDNYELLGLSCLLLAAKYLENDPTVPHLPKFIETYNFFKKEMMNNCDTKKDVKNANISFNDLTAGEVVTCKILNYNLNYFTIYDFNAFFFGHGIIKIEQLTDISEDYYEKVEENYFNDNNENENDLKYIPPNMVKRIMEKIYQKSRQYLNNVVKDKISLKYDSFLISIFIMYKSVEFVILKEFRIVWGPKIQDKYHMEKKEENLKRKTLKFFKGIMNEIYKIDLDSMEDYQYLIKDNDMLKIFANPKYNNRSNLNSKNEYDLSDRFDKIQINYRTNNMNTFQKINKIEKNKTDQKDYSPKKIDAKIPLDNYAIKKIKILERFSKANKNKFTRSFILPNKKEENILKKRINITITQNNNNNNQNNEILSKSNNTINISDAKNLDTIIKRRNKNKTINIDVMKNNNIIESYNSKNANDRYKNSIPYLNDINLKDYPSMPCKHYFHKLATEKEKNDKKNLDNSDILFNTNNAENRNRKVINLNKKINTVNQGDFSSLVKPYSRKVIPKNENKSKQIINRNINTNNKYKTRYINSNTYTNTNTNTNTDNSNTNNNYNTNTNNIDSSDLNSRNSNKNRPRNIAVDKSNNTSMDLENEVLSNIKTKFEKIKSNKKIRDNQLNSSNQYKNKYKGIPLLKSDIKKLSISVNKIKVNGVSNKHKLNKKLIFGMQSTPMKKDNNLKNALIRNIGVKRENTGHSLLKKMVTPEKSIEKLNNNKYNNKYKNDINNLDYSCINFSSNNFLNKIGIDSNRKVIKIKNKINNENSNNNLIKIDNKRDVSLSSEDEEFNEINDNNIKLNSIKINQFEDENNNKSNINNKNNKIQKLLDNIDIDNNSNTIEKKNPKIELIQINRKKSPTIVINNNINVNFANKSIDLDKPISKYKKYKYK